MKIRSIQTNKQTNCSSNWKSNPPMIRTDSRNFWIQSPSLLYTLNCHKHIHYTYTQGNLNLIYCKIRLTYCSSLLCLVVKWVWNFSVYWWVYINVLMLKRTQVFSLREERYRYGTKMMRKNPVLFILNWKYWCGIISY